MKRPHQRGSNLWWAHFRPRGPSVEEENRESAGGASFEISEPDASRLEEPFRDPGWQRGSWGRGLGVGRARSMGHSPAKGVLGKSFPILRRPIRVLSRFVEALCGLLRPGKKSREPLMERTDAYHGR